MFLFQDIRIFAINNVIGYKQPMVTYCSIRMIKGDNALLKIIQTASCSIPYQIVVYSIIHDSIDVKFKEP